MEAARQAVADVAHALNGNRASSRVGAAADFEKRGLDRALDAAGGGRRRTAERRGKATDVLRLLLHEDHVVRPRPDVDGCDVLPAELLDRATVRAEDRFPVEILGVGDDHGLAAAPRHAGGSRLIGHAFG